LADPSDDSLERLKRAFEALDLAQKTARTTAEEIGAAAKNINTAKLHIHKQPRRPRKRSERQRMDDDHRPSRQPPALIRCPGCREVAATSTGLSGDMRVMSLHCASCHQQFWIPYPPLGRPAPDET